MRRTPYFAYGSNMDAARMRSRGMRWDRGDRIAAKLAGYRLLFDKQAKLSPEVGYANVAKSSGSCVEGVLYFLKTPLSRLDGFEGYPIHYGRRLLLLETEEGLEQAYVYFAQPDFRVSGLLPTKEYMSHLLKGASFLSKRYATRLKAQPVFSGVLPKPQRPRSSPRQHSSKSGKVLDDSDEWFKKLQRDRMLQFGS